MIVGVDLGKTGCRARVAEGGGAHDGAEGCGPGAPGLAEPGGVAAALSAVTTVLGPLLGPLLAPLSTPLPTPLPTGATRSICVGAAGAEAAPGAARELAARLAEWCGGRGGPGGPGGAEVSVASDSTTAHAGALAGRPGSVLAVGTGVVALAVDAAGARTQLDGWGPWLGDDGGGAWIGREALRAVLRHREGRGPATLLSASAERRYGDLGSLPATLAAQGHLARTTAALVPDVLAAARTGDVVAGDVLERAVACWADLAARAVTAAGQPALALVGGLADVPDLVDRLARHLPADVRLVAAEGDAVHGALLLAGRTDLPHEPAVLRLRKPAPAPAAAPSPVPAAAPADDVDRLATEQVRVDLHDLDAREPEEVVALLLEAEASVPVSVAEAAPALGAAVRLATRALRDGGRLLYVGAGTPGRLAALDAAECPPTFGVDPSRVVAVCAGGDEAARTAVEGAEDDAAAGARDLAALRPTADDLVVGISASGRTPYVLAALEAARAAGAATVAVVNNPASPMAARADVTVEVLTGPETLSGSTRLKAGTSQKVALNVISTAAMVGAGHTYGAWMVDVLASNDKLRSRARRILREATGVDDAAALAALEEAGWRTKTALVSLLGGVTTTEADALLEAHGGHARAALAATPSGPRAPGVEGAP